MRPAGSVTPQTASSQHRRPTYLEAFPHEPFSMVYVLEVSFADDIFSSIESETVARGRHLERKRFENEFVGIFAQSLLLVGSQQGSRPFFLFVFVPGGPAAEVALSSRRQIP